MFYVKGKAFVLSFSKPPASSAILLPISKENQQQQQELVTVSSIDDKAKHSSTILHYLWGSIDMLPAFLAIASSMVMIAYLYTVLLLPTVMTATIEKSQNNTLTKVDNGTEVPLDTKCPFLKPRDYPPESVHDLRPDDIRIVAGLGDRYKVFFFKKAHYRNIFHINTCCSVMAAFAAKSVQKTFFNVANLYENRGISFAMGGVRQQKCRIHQHILKVHLSRIQT